MSRRSASKKQSMEQSIKLGKKRKIGGRTNGTWRKGIVSPNPAGRPRTGETWKELIERVGREETKDEKGKVMTWRERVVRAAFRNACITPTPAYWIELMDRSDEETPPELMLERLAEKYGISKEELVKDTGIAAILTALGFNRVA